MTAARNRALLEWYAAESRQLPWRSTSEPWPILVSEVMAQQTQIVRVIPLYEAFVARFPTPAALASASDLDVLQMWSGLGYNSRALRLKRSAAIISEEGWPTTPAGLRRLPGVGEYTAAAVACFAFGHQIAAVDTNLRRVLSRWMGTALDKDRLAEAASECVTDGSAAEWNQAVMDLGATHCKPHPSCESCPVADWCRDPSVYRRPPHQGTWAGSNRQARGAIVKSLLAGPRSRSDVLEQVAIDPSRFGVAVTGLVAEGIVAVVDDVYSIAE